MAKKPTISKDRRAQLRGELDQLLSSYNESSGLIEDSIVDAEFEQIKHVMPIDFEDLDKDFNTQAQDITRAMLKFYADLDILNKVEYVKQKRRVDNVSIQNIFFQLKTLRMAIETISEEINQGNSNPRLYEVFGQLHDKLSTVIKMQANYMLFLEDTYKKITHEANQKNKASTNTPLLQQGGDQYFISAGTKNIMQDIKADEVTEEVDSERTLTDPGKKAELIQSFGISPSSIEEDAIDLSDDINSLI